MSLTFNKLSKTLANFKQLRSLEVEEFRKGVEKVRGDWENLDQKVVLKILADMKEQPTQRPIVNSKQMQSYLR